MFGLKNAIFTIKTKNKKRISQVKSHTQNLLLTSHYKSKIDVDFFLLYILKNIEAHFSIKLL